MREWTDWFSLVLAQLSTHQTAITAKMSPEVPPFAIIQILPQQSEPETSISESH